jgi:hypothetical protein
MTTNALAEVAIDIKQLATEVRPMLTAGQLDHAACIIHQAAWKQGRSGLSGLILALQVGFACGVLCSDPPKQHPTCPTSSAARSASHVQRGAWINASGRPGC